MVVHFRNRGGADAQDPTAFKVRVVAAARPAGLKGSVRNDPTRREVLVHEFEVAPMTGK